MNRCQCGETIVELLFNLPRCINPRCRFFNGEFLRNFILKNDPVHTPIDVHGWTNPFFLGSFGNFADDEATIYDLWYVEPDDKSDPCFVAQYGSGGENCYWNRCADIRESREIRGTFPELDEAMRRFDILLQLP